VAAVSGPSGGVRPQPDGQVEVAARHSLRAGDAVCVAVDPGFRDDLEPAVHGLALGDGQCHRHGLAAHCELPLERPGGVRDAYAG